MRKRKRAPDRFVWAKRQDGYVRVIRQSIAERDGWTIIRAVYDDESSEGHFPDEVKMRFPLNRK